MESEVDESNYPAWLYRDLIENSLPWKQGTKMSFPEFDSKYTLHDSNWIGIFLDVAYKQTAILAVDWDAVWLPDEIKQMASNISEYTFLFIQLTNVEEIGTSNYQDISGACRVISGSEFEQIQEKKFLAIDDLFGGQINLVYRGEETFLAMESDRTILSI